MFSRHQQTTACSQSQPLPCFCMAMSQEWFYIFKWLGKTQKKYLVTHTSDKKFRLQCPQIKFDWNTFMFLGLLLSMLFLLYNGNVEWFWQRRYGLQSLKCYLVLYRKVCDSLAYLIHKNSWQLKSLIHLVFLYHVKHKTNVPNCSCILDKQNVK